jgi:predicted phosphodiesterase
MRIAVISDVHGNFHALERAFETIADEGVDVVWCLGDTVGYGPLPNECCRLVDREATVCLAGNHDLLALGRIVFEHDFNPDAAAAGAWTAAVLDHESRTFLGGLEPEAHVDGADLYHASARDPVWEYVLDGGTARATFELSSAQLVFVGHSHVPLAISVADDELSGGHAPAGTEVDLGGRRWLLNPGSVGQPRDGDPRAAWLLVDAGRRRAEFKRVEYDVAGTQAEIRTKDLPESLAVRLGHGL